MLPMMILGVTALGVVTIPMGFQFLAVISGKAFLFAKMALMLAIMNGAKKVYISAKSFLLLQFKCVLAQLNSLIISSAWIKIKIIFLYL